MRDSTKQRREEENNAGVENTVVQILNNKGWQDYSRTNEIDAYAWCQYRTAYFRSVDWITKEVLFEEA